MSIFFLCVILIWILFGNFLYNSIFNKEKAVKRDLNLSEEKEMEWRRKIDRDFRILKEYKNFEEIYIKSKDSIRLHAYYLYADSPKWVILCHDYMEDAKSVSSIALYYKKRNFNILMLDARGHGKSMGKILSLGVLDSVDLMQWISYIIVRQPYAQIVLHGISMGAQAMLLNGSRIPSNIACIILEDAYTSVYDLLYYQFHLRFGILTSPLLISLGFVTKLRAGFTLKEVSALEKVEKCQAPILLLHTKEDEWVPSIMMEALYKTGKGEKQKYLLNGVHGLAYFLDDRYEKILDSFFKKYMGVEK